MGILDLDRPSARAWAQHVGKAASPAPDAGGTPLPATLSAPAAPPFDFERFARQIAEVTQAVLPLLEPAEQVVYYALFYAAYSRGQSACTLTQAALAAATGVSRATLQRQLLALEQRRLIAITRQRRTPCRYRVFLSEEAQTGLPWRVPREWELRKAPPSLPIDNLIPDDRERLAILYRSLDSREKEAVHQRALLLMREAGWSAAEHAAADDLLRYRLQAAFTLHLTEDGQHEMLDRVVTSAP